VAIQGIPLRSSRAQKKCIRQGQSCLFVSPDTGPEITARNPDEISRNQLKNRRTNRESIGRPLADDIPNHLLETIDERLELHGDLFASRSPWINELTKNHADEAGTVMGKFQQA
jgi:hypothetical protein